MAVVELIVGNITVYAKTDMIGEGSYQNVAGLIIMKLLFFLGTLIFYNIKSMKLNSAFVNKKLSHLANKKVSQL